MNASDRLASLEYSPFWSGLAQLDGPPSVVAEDASWLSQWPWFILIVASLPLVFASTRARVYPTLRWLWPLMAAIGLSVVAIFVPTAVAFVWLVDLALLTLTAIDFALLWLGSGGRRAAGIDVSRDIARTCSLGVSFKSKLTVRNRTRMRLRGEFLDDLPETFAVTPARHPLDLAVGIETTVSQQITPHRRGAFTLQAIHLRFLSPLGLWQRHLTLPVADSLNVYPDMKQLSDYALLARTNRLSLIGVRRTRRIGQDSDFERLRDYTRDDNYRHMDWRSTARRNKLTVRQFQTDQSQRLVFLLDCGRMMTNERNGYSLLDHSLNAALMMAYVALHQGDSVGMLCFSDQIHAYIPPRGGPSQMNRLLQAGFDQFPRMVESRFDQAFLYLNQRCKRRSLVTLTTNVVDEVNAGMVVDHLANLSGTHLPLGVLLRDREMFSAADAPLLATAAAGQVTSGESDPPSATEGLGEFQMYRAAAAADILLWRHQVLNNLRHRGVLVVDAFPDELAAPMVNEYLRVKANHLL